MRRKSISQVGAVCSLTNHPCMHVLSSSKGKETQGQSVFSLSTFSSDSRLDGSWLLPAICRGHKWSPNGLMTVKTKPKKHVAPQSSTQLVHFRESLVCHVRNGIFHRHQQNIGWCHGLRRDGVAPLRLSFQTHIEGVLASFNSTTPHKDMLCSSLLLWQFSVNYKRTRVRSLLEKVPTASRLHFFCCRV